MRQHFKFPKNKFGAEKTVFDGITFDSKIEGERYLFLKDMQERGLISNLQCHKTYELVPKQTRQEVVHLKTKDKIVERTVFRNVEFTPDFVYQDKEGKLIAEDVKGFLVAEDFTIRRKLLYYLHGVYVYIVRFKKKTWVME